MARSLLTTSSDQVSYLKLNKVRSLLVMVDFRLLDNPSWIKDKPQN